MVGKKYVTKDDLEAFARKLIRRISGSTFGIGGLGEGGVESFVDLDDVPSSYIGESLQAVRVNVGETALEFFDLDLASLSDVDLSGGGAPSDGDCLTYDGIAGKWIAAPCGSGGSGSGGGATHLCDLLDVDCESPTIPVDGDILMYYENSPYPDEWRPRSLKAELESFLFAYRVQGRYYGSGVGAPSLTTGSFGTGYLRAMPFIVSRIQSFDRIGLGVTAGQAAGRYIRLGIYRNKAGEYAYPGDLVLDAGSIEITTAQFWEVVIDQELEPDLYWLALDVSYSSLTIRLFTQSYGGPSCGMPDGATQAGSYFTVAHVFGALPDPFPAAAGISSNVNPPAVVLRVK